MAALDGAGFPRHFVPAGWGGCEGTFTEVFDDVLAVARQCASAGWCAGLWAAHGRFAAHLPEAGQRDIWAAGPEVRIAAGLVPPAGAARAVPGGWEVTGRWSTVSGAEHADWVLLAVADTAGVDGAGAGIGAGVGGPRVFAVRSGELAIEDTWNSLGLRGTGSHTVTAPRPLSVPDRLSTPLAAMIDGTGPPGRARCHTVPAHLAGGLLFCAPALGAARTALDHWAGTAGPGADELLTRSAAELDAVELLLREALRRADHGPVTPAAVARNRRDAAYGAERLAAVVDSLVRHGGSAQRELDGELNRAWRDVLTVASHGGLRLSAAAAPYAVAHGSAPVPAAPVPAGGPANCPATIGP